MTDTTPVEELEKQCPECDRELPKSDFHSNTARSDGLTRKCRECRNAYSRERNNIESARRYRRDWKLQDRYGITMDEYEQMIEDQDGLCLICGNTPSSNQKGDSLHVDHDHDTGEVRGLLCNECNVGIANFEHEPERLRSAAKYLERAALRATRESDDGG